MLCHAFCELVLLSKIKTALPSSSSSSFFFFVYSIQFSFSRSGVIVHDLKFERNKSSAPSSIDSRAMNDSTAMFRFVDMTISTWLRVLHR